MDNMEEAGLSQRCEAEKNKNEEGFDKSIHAGLLSSRKDILNPTGKESRYDLPVSKWSE